MPLPTVLTTAVALALVATASASSADEAQWDAFKQTYGKSYPSELHERKALNAFTTNLRMYEQRTRYSHANYGVDQWSDLTLDAFVARNGGCYSPEPVGSRVYTDTELREVRSQLLGAHPAVDWRAKGATTPAKDQGAFGTCWAFGVSAVLEGINVVQKNNSLVSLCEQEVIDCCVACDGSGPGTSWDWLINNTHGRIDTEVSYPYAGDKPRGKCEPKTAKASDAHVTSWKIIHQDAKTKSDDPYLLEMMKTGPCNIGVDASCLSGYKDGVITNCTGKAVDHANVIVGAGTTPATEGSVDYFIVRNSWGQSFGMDGYYKVARNTGQMQIDACWHAYF